MEGVLRGCPLTYCIPKGQNPVANYYNELNTESRNRKPICSYGSALSQVTSLSWALVSSAISFYEKLLGHPGYEAPWARSPALRKSACIEGHELLKFSIFLQTSLVCSKEDLKRHQQVKKTMEVLDSLSLEVCVGSMQRLPLEGSGFCI